MPLTPYHGTGVEKSDNGAIGHQTVLEEEGYGVDQGKGGPTGEQLCTVKT